MHSVFEEPVNTVHLSEICLRDTQACLQQCESSILLSNFVCVTTGCSSSSCVFVKWGHQGIPFFFFLNSEISSIFTILTSSTMKPWANFLCLCCHYNPTMALSGMRFMNRLLDIFFQYLKVLASFSFLNDILKCCFILSVHGHLLTWSVHRALCVMLRFIILCI